MRYICGVAHGKRRLLPTICRSEPASKEASVAMSQADKQSTLPACGVAVDMGASHLRFVLATKDGEILDESREPLRAESGPGGVIAQVRDGIRSLVDRRRPQIRLQGIA